MIIPLFLRLLPSVVLKENDSILECSGIQLRLTHEWFELQVALSCEVFHGEPCFIDSRAELRIRTWT